MLAGAVAESSHLVYNHEAHAHTHPHRSRAGNGLEYFETSKPFPSDITSPNKSKPTNPHQIVPPRQDKVF